MIFIKKLTNNEEKVMNSLWSSEYSLSGSEIQKFIPEFSKGVIAEILTNLVKKNFILIDEVKVINKSLTRFFKPKISEEEYFSTIIPERALKKLITDFISKNKGSKETKELYEVLKESFSDEKIKRVH